MLHCTMKLLLYVHRVSIGESIRESAETVLQNDKFLILAINRLSPACSMLITATIYVIDLNTLKTSQDALISINCNSKNV